MSADSFQALAMSSAGAAQGFAPKRSLRGLGVVLAFHALLFWALASGLAQRAVEVIKAPIQAKLIQEAPTEPPPPPPLLPPPPRAVVPQMEPLPAPVVVPVNPVVQNAPPPVAAAPAPVAPPTPVNPPPAEAVRLQAAPPAPPPPPPPQPAAASVKPEDAYLGQLRAYVNSIKRYPTSREARQLRPQGTVRVWIEIDRAGQLLGTGIEATSGSLLLDNEALRTLRNGRFPPFPPEAFAGQGSHRFVMSVEYQTEGG